MAVALTSAATVAVAASAAEHALVSSLVPHGGSAETAMSSGPQSTLRLLLARSNAGVVARRVHFLRGARDMPCAARFVFVIVTGYASWKQRCTARGNDSKMAGWHNSQATAKKGQFWT